MKKNYQFIIVFLCLFSIHHSFSQNATWHVAPGGTGNGTSWATAAGDLQAIVDNAAAGDQVWVKQGAYQRGVGQTFALRDGVSIYGGFPTTANPVLADRNPRQYPTLLNGNQAGVLLAAGGVESISAATIFDGFTIQNGTGTAGAGMLIYNCDATFRNLIVTNNTSPVGLGGGIAISNSNSSFIQVLVHHNTAVLNPGYDGEAGGIRINSGNVKFYNCVIANNHAEGLVGGLMVVTATVHLYNTIIYGNTDELNPQFFVDPNYDGGSGANLFASNCILEGCRGSDFLFEAVQYAIYGTDLGGNLDANPMFNADYSVQAASVGVNKGNTQAYLDAVGSIDKDFFNNNRVVDHIDIGLNEHQTVQSEVLYVKEGGTGDGSSWANASGDLQLMMDDQFEGREVWVAEGTYYAPSPYFRLRSKVKVYGGFPTTGNPAFADRDHEAHPSVLKSNSNYTIGNFFPESSNLSAETLLDGFVLTRDADHTLYTIGVMESNSNATYSNILFTGFGYGTIETRRTSQNTFMNCTIADNSFLDDDYYNVTIHIGAHTTFLDCTFTGNNYFLGSAICAMNNGNVTIDGCVFTNNAGLGVGKVVLIDHSRGSITNSVFDNNGNNNLEGAIVMVAGTFDQFTPPDRIHPVDVVIDGCTFKNNINTALQFQGKPVDKLTVSNSLFVKNTGSVGGGIRRHNGGDIYITNSTITENHASNQWAGGLFVSESDGVTQVRNSIIYGNTSVYTYMPDFWTYGQVSFKNTILAQSGGSANWQAGFFTDFTLPVTNLAVDMGGNLDTAPLFVDAANEDYRLMPTSPAVNAGDSAVFAANAVPDLSGFTTDLAGNARIVGTAVDMGAFEFDPEMGTGGFEQAKGISVYPNPAEGMVTIILNDATITGVKIYSVLGKEVAASANATIDLSVLPTGVYIVKATADGDKTYSAKLVKK